MREKGTRDAGPPSALIKRRFVGTLWTVYVEDSAESMRMIMDSDLEDLKLDADRLHALAIKNMQREFPKIPYIAIDEMPNTWVVNAGDSYDAARMVLHEQWNPLAAEVDGELILAVPKRDFAVFTSTASPNAIRALRQFAEQAAQSDAYALTSELFRWTPAGWVVYPK